MPLRFNTCPHCKKRITFRIEMEDIDPSLYPAAFYLYHKNKDCNKISTFYVDSLLRVSFIEPEKKKPKSGIIIKTIETL